MKVKNLFEFSNSLSKTNRFIEHFSLVKIFEEITWDGFVVVDFGVVFEGFFVSTGGGGGGGVSYKR